MQRGYNREMLLKNINRLFLLIALLGASFSPTVKASAAPAAGRETRASAVTAGDLIAAMNSLRVSLGNSPLIEDGIIDAVAQATAETMAASQMSWHIGNVEGRVAAAGYGAGANVIATENFAVGSDGFSIDEIMVVWSDASHMIPAVNPAYCNVGAGVATAPNGMIYYVLQAAYTSGQSCGSYTTSSGSGSSGIIGVPQIVVPVEIAEPDADGKVFHEVKAGQSFWSIAIAYKLTINDLETWNNLSRSNGLRIGQKLFIPGDNTQGYSTPTPMGMFALSTPAADGRIIHNIAAYQNLTTIAQAYGVTVSQITSLNGIQADAILSIGQNLLISTGGGTPSPDSLPLTALEKLTPAEDGMYYHEVQSGETLYGIASYYGINYNELMGWNGLTADSLIRPGQDLLLQVTPPATLTPTPAPATETPVPSNTPPATRTATLPALSQTPITDAANEGGNPTLGYVLIGVSAVGLLAAWQFWRRRRL